MATDECRSCWYWGRVGEREPGRLMYYCPRVDMFTEEDDGCLAFDGELNEGSCEWWRRRVLEEMRQGGAAVEVVRGLSSLVTRFNSALELAGSLLWLMYSSDPDVANAAKLLVEGWVDVIRPEHARILRSVRRYFRVTEERFVASRSQYGHAAGGTGDGGQDG